MCVKRILTTCGTTDWLYGRITNSNLIGETGTSVGDDKIEDQPEIWSVPVLSRGYRFLQIPQSVSQSFRASLIPVCRNQSFSSRLTLYWLQEVSHTPAQQKNHPPHTACFNWLSANLRIVQWFVPPRNLSHFRPSRRAPCKQVWQHASDVSLVSIAVNVPWRKVAGPIAGWYKRTDKKYCKFLAILPKIWYLTTAFYSIFYTMHL